MNRKIIPALIIIALLISIPVSAGAEEKIPVVFFSTPGCEECAIVRNYLESLKEIYPQIDVKEYSVSEPQNKELLATFGKVYALAENKIGVTPAVFMGKRAFVREDAFKGLDKVIEEYDPSETAFLESALKSGGGDSHLVELFNRFGVLTVLGAGLIDGYNPCAITVLIFFISLLLLKGTTRRNILNVGVAFTIGIGVSYLLLGVGLFNLISRWKYFDAIAKWVYMGTAILTLVLAILTIRDYFRARSGRVSDITLQLSNTEKRTIHSLLRNPKIQTMAIFSFFVAFPVSIVEFSCTGQTYLPTIVYIFSMPTLRGKAFIYLILYNLMFLLPLILIVFFTYRGATSEKITQWFTRNLATIKLVTGIVFIVLFIYLLNRTLLLFGVSLVKL